MNDHIVKEETGDMRVTGMLTGNDPGAALRGDNLERLKARDEHLAQWAAAEIERLRGVEKAAQWFADNPDSPISALAHICEALDA